MLLSHIATLYVSAEYSYSLDLVQCDRKTHVGVELPGKMVQNIVT